MEKYKLLCISIILLILSFLDSWYGDQLFDKYFIFALIPSLILFASYIIYLIQAIKAINKEKTWVNITTLLIFITIPIMIFTFPFRIAKARFEMVIYEKQRNEVIDMVKENKLTCDYSNTVELPNKYKKLSSSGEIIIYKNDEAGIVVGFWVFRGMMSGSIEVIYSSLGKDLIKANESGHPISSIERLEDNWFYVVTDY